MALVPLDEVIHFDVVTSDPSTGGVSDADSTPTFDVFEEATDTGLLGNTNLTKRTSLTGNYRGTFTASAANGFEAGRWYTVVASATVGGTDGKTVAMHFRLAPAESVAGVPKVDVAHLAGDAQSLTDLKDFADAGYDPGTNKVQGVVLVDTLTTYTSNTPQTGDAFARLGAPIGASISAMLLDLVRVTLRSDAGVATDLASLITQINGDLGAGAGSYAPESNALRAIATAVGDVSSDVDEILLDTGTDGVVLTSTGLQTSAVTEIRDAITGGAYALSTDASGRVRIVDGTAAGELDTALGLVKISGTIQTLDALDTSLKTDNDVTQAAIAALNNVSTAQVLAEMQTALATTTRAKPGAVTPPVAPSIVEAIMQLYQDRFHPHKQTEGAGIDTYNLAGDTVIQTRTITVVPDVSAMIGALMAA
jgi:hypothetical protein